MTQCCGGASVDMEQSESSSPACNELPQLRSLLGSEEHGSRRQAERDVLYVRACVCVRACVRSPDPAYHNPSRSKTLPASWALRCAHLQLRLPQTLARAGEVKVVIPYGAEERTDLSTRGKWAYG